jgi:hypothetical protein
MTHPATTLGTADTQLTRSDRCDRCGAQAFIRVRLPAGGELLFCVHHGRQYEGRLREIDATIEDESETLEA